MRSTPHRLPGVADDPQVRVALVAAAALMVEAVLAKNVLHVRLDYISQFAALWVFLAFQWSGQRDRLSEIATSVVIVLVTAGVLVFYAI